MEVIQFLNEHNIAKREYGPRTTRGWVQVKQCPFCYGDDYYLGINLSGNFFHCWLCGRSGSIEFLIKVLLQTTFNRAKKIAEEYGWKPYFDSEKTTSTAEKVIIKGLTGLRELHINYLKSRNFDHLLLQRLYDIQANYTVGRFPYRIVIPVYDNGVLVNATARDVTGQQPERYMSLRNDESIIPIKECVYNIDSTINSENILVVEGPSDVWRIGGATVSLFGTAFKTAQYMRIVAQRPKNVFILFDNEEIAQEQADKLGKCLSPFIPHVESIEIEELQTEANDPGELSLPDAEYLRKELKI